MTEQAAGGSNDHRGTATQTLNLLVETRTVVTAIDGDAAHILQVVGKALHRLVNLLGQFAGGRHHNTVDGILGESAVVEHGEDRQQIGGCLTSTRLSYAQHVVTIKDFRDATFLNGCHLLEVHVVQRIKDIIVEICFFKCHKYFLAVNFSLLTITFYLS